MNLPVGLPLFDAVASEAAKGEGRQRAVYGQPPWNRHLLEAARGVAHILARRNGEVTADDVVRHFAEEGTDLPGRIGNAMGSLFAGKEWVWTGRYAKSTRVHAHANLLRVWRLR